MTEPIERPEANATDHGTRIQALLPTRWSAEVLAALDMWRQGDVLEGGPLFWAGPAGNDLVLPIDGSPEPFHITEDPGPGRLIVTSQTCDIGGKGPGRFHPFVSTCPVYALTDASVLGHVKAGRVSYLVWVRGAPGSGDHVADLRVTMPLSKGILAATSPLDYWASEPDRLGFAEAIASKYRRPALHDSLSEEVKKSLNAYIIRSAPDTDWSDRVEEVRLRIEGDRLKPSAVQLLVLFDAEPERAHKLEWRGWTKQGTKILKAHGIKLLPSMFITLEKLPARAYKSSVPLHLSNLNRPPTW